VPTVLREAVHVPLGSGGTLNVSSVIVKLASVVDALWNYWALLSGKVSLL